MTPRKQPRLYTEWECVRCGLTYTNPIPVAAAWHRCKARNGLTRMFKPRKETQ